MQQPNDENMDEGQSLSDVDMVGQPNEGESATQSDVDMAEQSNEGISMSQSDVDMEEQQPQRDMQQGDVAIAKGEPDNIPNHQSEEIDSGANVGMEKGEATEVPRQQSEGNVSDTNQSENIYDLMDEVELMLKLADWTTNNNQDDVLGSMICPDCQQKMV